MTVGERIKHKRTQLGFTQQELADAMGIQQKKIWQYETGKTSPKGDDLAKMAKIFGVSTDWILGISNSLQGNLDPNEIELLELYRSKSLDKQAAAVRLLEAL